MYRYMQELKSAYWFMCSIGMTHDQEACELEAVTYIDTFEEEEARPWRKADYNTKYLLSLESCKRLIKDVLRSSHGSQGSEHFRDDLKVLYSVLWRGPLQSVPKYVSAFAQ